MPTHHNITAIKLFTPSFITPIHRTIFIQTFLRFSQTIAEYRVNIPKVNTGLWHGIAAVTARALQLRIKYQYALRQQHNVNKINIASSYKTYSLSAYLHSNKRLRI